MHNNELTLIGHSNYSTPPIQKNSSATLIPQPRLKLVPKKKIVDADSNPEKSSIVGSVFSTY